VIRDKLKVQAIIVAAGLGTRLNSKIPKPLVMLKGKPIFVYTLEIFEKSSLVDSIILVVHEQNFIKFSKLCREYDFKKLKSIIIGGETRCDSVGNGLKVLKEDTEIVIIHDGARPLVSERIIDESIQLCKDYEAVVAAVPVKPTIKKVNLQDMVVEATLDRHQLWEIQTPQVFKKDIILKAHQQEKGSLATDDAFLVERMGVPVKVLKGDYRNIKVTTQEDLVLAEGLLGLNV